MSILNFQRFVRSETSAARIIHRYRFGDGPGRQGPLPVVQCPRCATRGAYALSDGRWRCGRCRYTFGLVTETWLEACRLSPLTWLWVIKLFELELVAQQAGVQLGLSYPTILRAFTTIRRALVAAAEPRCFRPTSRRMRVTSGRATRRAVGAIRGTRAARRRTRSPSSAFSSAMVACRSR